MIYNKIKYLCDVKYGIINICAQATTSKFLNSRPDQYFANIALKFNLKLGGVNHTIKDPTSSLGIIAKGKTMVVGIDVTHPSPGSTDSAPSVAAMVASVNADMGQWPATLSIQHPTVEMVDGLKEMLKTHLNIWLKNNNRVLPENILVYRDGVSESQYQGVLTKELPELRKACDDLYGKKRSPNITIVVVGKRHHSRFYTADAKRNLGGGNPQNGTVVDRAVTLAHNWDFFLQSHHAIKGTARPAHYFVIYDQIFKNTTALGSNAADTLEKLTHNMCYLFGRATKAVSICPAVYYADLVCERARCYLPDQFAPVSGGSSGGSDNGSSPQKVLEGSSNQASSSRAVTSIGEDISKLTMTDQTKSGNKNDPSNDPPPSPSQTLKDMISIHHDVRETMFYI